MYWVTSLYGTYTSYYSAVVHKLSFDYYTTMKYLCKSFNYRTPSGEGSLTALTLSNSVIPSNIVYQSTNLVMIDQSTLRALYIQKTYSTYYPTRDTQSSNFIFNGDSVTC